MLQRKAVVSGRKRGASVRTFGPLEETIRKYAESKERRAEVQRITETHRLIVQHFPKLFRLDWKLRDRIEGSLGENGVVREKYRPRNSTLPHRFILSTQFCDDPCCLRFVLHRENKNQETCTEII